jgi:amino acid transporter
MGIPLELSFVIFTGLGAVLFAASGAGVLAGRGGSLLLPVTGLALAAMVGSVASLGMHLGHPERIFGALVNVHSLFSRELIAILVAIVLMAAFAYRLARGMALAKPLAAVAVLTSIALLVFTAQLAEFWISHRKMVGQVGAGCVGYAVAAAPGRTAVGDYPVRLPRAIG